jgi:ABC-type amino acid transport substrate-binding protein
MVAQRSYSTRTEEVHVACPKLWLRRIIVVVFSLFLFTGCSTPSGAAVQPLPLRVGVWDFPPLVYRTSGGYLGAEAEMASLLGKSLGRRVQFVHRRFDDLIPSLLAGEIDIIMAGMTITAERKVRINFSDPYLRSGLTVAMRADKAQQFDSVTKIYASAETVGVVGGTIAESYVRRNFPSRARVLLIGKPSDAPFELKSRRIDVYVDDAPSIAWVVSSNAAEVQGLFEPLTDDYYGWGINKGNHELLDQVNAVLAQWKKDGTLERILRRWLPYLKSYD